MIGLATQVISTPHENLLVGSQITWEERLEYVKKYSLIALNLTSENKGYRINKLHMLEPQKQITVSGWIYCGAGTAKVGIGICDYSAARMTLDGVEIDSYIPFEIGTTKKYFVQDYRNVEKYVGDGTWDGFITWYAFYMKEETKLYIENLKIEKGCWTEYVNEDV